MPGPPVLFVNHGAALGGGELSLLDIVRHSAPRARVALLSDGPLRDRLEAEGIPSVLLELSPEALAVRRERAHVPWRALASVLRTGFRLARIVRPGELLYANSQKAFVVAAIASALRRHRLIWHLRDILSPDHFSRSNIRLVVRLANGCATRVIANSRASAEAFVASGGRAAKVRVVHSGVDPSLFRAAAGADAAQVRRELGLNGQGPLVGVFGRLAPWKGQHVAIEAVAGLEDAALIVVGAPLFGETAYQQELQYLIARLGVSNRVRLLGFRQDVPRLMRAVDVVLHTSLAPEPFGRVLVEAMLTERPVIATDGGGAREVVEDGVTGYLVPAGEPGRLAAALRPLLASPELRLTLGVNGRRRAEQCFILQETLRALDAEITTAAGTR